jgi:Protein of unknown function (DUF2281)
MITIIAILEPDADGSVHLPVPPELRLSAVKVTATMEAVANTGAQPRFGCLAGKIELSPDFDEPLEDFKEYME